MERSSESVYFKRWQGTASARFASPEIGTPVNPWIASRVMFLTSSAPEPRPQLTRVEFCSVTPRTLREIFAASSVVES